MSRRINSKYMAMLTAVSGLLFAVDAAADVKPKDHTGPLGMAYQMRVDGNYGYEDNITYQAKSSDAINSNFYSVKPQFRMKAEFNDDSYVFRYEGDYREYETSSEDSYQDHKLVSDNNWKLGQRYEVNLLLEKKWQHEVRGDESTDGLSTDQLEFYGIKEALETENNHGELRLRYGALDARGKLDIAVVYNDMTFRDLSSVKSESQDPDFYGYLKEQEWQQPSLYIDLFDQYSPITRFRYSFLWHHRTYEANPDKDSNEFFLVYGLKTQFAGKTFLDGNIGWVHKDFFNQGDAEQFNGVNWKIDLKWEPDPYSVFALNTSQEVQDPTESGGYILETSAGISWKYHWWVDRLYTEVGYTYTREKYKNRSSDREDETDEVRFAIGYDYRPSIHFTLEYISSTEDSNKDTDEFYIQWDNQPDINLGYDRSIVMLLAKVQF